MTVCKSKRKSTQIWNKWQVVANENCNGTPGWTLAQTPRFWQRAVLQPVARSDDWQSPDCCHFVRLLFQRAANISPGSEAYTTMPQCNDALQLECTERMWRTAIGASASADNPEKLLLIVLLLHFQYFIRRTHKWKKVFVPGKKTTMLLRKEFLAKLTVNKAFRMFPKILVTL